MGRKLAIVVGTDSNGHLVALGLFETLDAADSAIAKLSAGFSYVAVPVETGMVLSRKGDGWDLVNLSA